MKEGLNQTKVAKEILEQEHLFWQDRFSRNPSMFGDVPSEPAQKAAELFKKESLTKILELGGGQGRDSIFFAQNGFRVHVLDYCDSAVETITQKVQALGLSQSITVTSHDVRNPLPFDAHSFDACFSHALLSTCLVTSEQEFLLDEIQRILKPGGLNIYTARNMNDPHYGTGIYRGEDMYEVGGGTVNYFSKEKVMSLAKGYEIIDVVEFEEGKLPRRLFQVTLRKK